MNLPFSSWINPYALATSMNPLGPEQSPAQMTPPSGASWSSLAFISQSALALL